MSFTYKLVVNRLDRMKANNFFIFFFGELVRWRSVGALRSDDGYYFFIRNNRFSYGGSEQED